MAETSNPNAVFLPPSEFDDFLFASVGEGGNGMTLSVLSMLARTGVDPWQTAAELARLSRKSAGDKLVALIDALPEGVGDHRDPATVALRLIALLPRRKGPNLETLAVKPGQAAVNYQMVGISIVALALVLAIGWISANRGAPAVSEAGSHRPAVGTVPQQTPDPKMPR